MQEKIQQPEIQDDSTIVEIIALEDDSEIDFEALAACQGPTMGSGD